jgi:hypothetical protein
MTVRETQNPVQTLEQVVWWLVAHSTATSDFIDANHSVDNMPPEAVLVCDLFWLTRENLRQKLVNAFRSLGAAPPSARRWSHRSFRGV